MRPGSLSAPSRFERSWGKPNTRVTSRKVDPCFGRNLLTSGIPSAQMSLTTSLFRLAIRNQVTFGVAIGQWPTQLMASDASFVVSAKSRPAQTPSRQPDTLRLVTFVESTINQVVTDDSSKNSRCSGHCAGRIFCCRPGRGSSTRIWTTYSAVGIRNSGRNHKRRNQSARRLDPRLFGALLFDRLQ